MKAKTFIILLLTYMFSIPPRVTGWILYKYSLVLDPLGVEEYELFKKDMNEVFDYIRKSRA